MDFLEIFLILNQITTHNFLISINYVLYVFGGFTVVAGLFYFLLIRVWLQD